MGKEKCPNRSDAAITGISSKEKKLKTIVNYLEQLL